MKINFFSQALLLALSGCCIFAAEKTTGETSAEKVRQEIANQAAVLKLLDDPNWRVQFPGVNPIEITQEMVHGSDLAGKLSEEIRKKNVSSFAPPSHKAMEDLRKASADVAENKQPSSDEEICSLRIILKW